MLVLISVNVMGQEQPIQFDEVIKAEGKSVSEVYTTVKTWVATNFNSAQDVIQMDDPDNGILVCRGLSNMTTVAASWVQFWTDGCSIHSKCRYEKGDTRCRWVISPIKPTR